MSYIFRSDAVSLGDRVVVRRRYHDAGAQHTDIIGHIMAQSPEALLIRPQSIGGFLSDLPEIRIPTADIVIIKKLSPRRVRNSEIRAIEVAYAHAFPGKVQEWSSDGQWLFRAGDGITERSNSAAPLGHSASFSAIPWEEIFDFYHRHKLPIQLLLPERIARVAEQQCQGPQWQLGPEILVLSCALDSLPEAAPQPPAPHYQFELHTTPTPEWFELYHFRGHALPASALTTLAQQIHGLVAFAHIRDTTTNAIVAITRATITDEYLGFSAVEVHPNYRRQGLGTYLGQCLMHWGKDQAHTAYLQAIHTNTAGIQAYQKLGFIEHHRHRYALFQGEEPIIDKERRQ